MNSATLEQNEIHNQPHSTTSSKRPHSNLGSNPGSTNPGTANPVALSLVDDVRFTDFNISDSLKNRLTNAGFTTPTPVQAKAIPPALEGNDILALPRQAPAKLSASSSR